MDGCPRDTRNRYDEWSYWSQTTQTSSEYYDMDIKYNEVLDRIQRDEKEYCSKKNKYDEKKYEGAESGKWRKDRNLPEVGRWHSIYDCCGVRRNW